MSAYYEKASSEKGGFNFLSAVLSICPKKNEYFLNVMIVYFNMNGYFYERIIFDDKMSKCGTDREHYFRRIVASSKKSITFLFTTHQVKANDACQTI